MPGFAALAREVRAHLGQEARYAHCVRVARCAQILARRHGADPQKAWLAGLLHDLARLYPRERLISESRARALPIEPYELEHPVLLHARLGAAIARDAFGVEDPEVLSAIAKHTTGAAEMSPLDRVVYLADSLEPGRTFPERGALWDLAVEISTAPCKQYSLQRCTISSVKAERPPRRRSQPREHLALPDLIEIVRNSALDKKGEDFTALDVSGRTILADTFVIVSGRSKVQTRAIADAIVESVKKSGYTVGRLEGYADGSWILIDIGNVIVHVFTPEQRTFYNLERLWSSVMNRQAQSS